MTVVSSYGLDLANSAGIRDVKLTVLRTNKGQNGRSYKLRRIDVRWYCTYVSLSCF
jgi:hypothetical protein